MILPATRLLVSGATRVLAQYAGHPNLGGLVTPRTGNDPAWYARHRFPYAADNDAYSNFDDIRYLRMLDRLAATEQQPLWVTVPDVVGDARATAQRWVQWAGVLRDFGLPAAYVAQNGVDPDDIPWTQIACVFIGGDDDFKLGPAAHRVASRAHVKGCAIHVGRVNSLKRIGYARWLGAATIDGSSASMFSATWIPSYLGELHQDRLPLHPEEEAAC